MLNPKPLNPKHSYKVPESQPLGKLPRALTNSVGSLTGGGALSTAQGTWVPPTTDAKKL